MAALMSFSRQAAFHAHPGNALPPRRPACASPLLNRAQRRVQRAGQPKRPAHERNRSPDKRGQCANRRSGFPHERIPCACQRSEPAKERIHFANEPKDSASQRNLPAHERSHPSHRRIHSASLGNGGAEERKGLDIERKESANGFTPPHRLRKDDAGSLRKDRGCLWGCRGF